MTAYDPIDALYLIYECESPDIDELTPDAVRAKAALRRASGEECPNAMVEAALEGLAEMQEDTRCEAAGIRRIYLYGESCHQQGRIYCGTDAEARRCGDVFLWDEGTSDELIAEALDRLANKNLYGLPFAWKCALNVLEYLSGPEVEWDDATGTYRVRVDADEEDDEDEDD